MNGDRFTGRVQSAAPARRCGFTLIELLVVVAVIAILAAVLFPALQGSLDRGRAAVCLSNMRQVGVGFALFAADQNGSFPLWYYNDISPSRPGQRVWWYWCDLIQPYVDPGVPRPVTGGAGESVGVQEGSGNKFRSTVFDCPSHKNAAHMEFKYNQIVGRYQNGQFLNSSFQAITSTIDEYTSVFGVRLDAVNVAKSAPTMSRFIVVIDAINRDYPGLDNFAAGGQFMTRTKFLHQNGTQFNAVYADGHASSHDGQLITGYSSGPPFNLPP